MKTILLISGIAPLIFFLLRVKEIVSALFPVSRDAVYACGMSVERECTLFEFIFTSDSAIVSYILMFLGFVISLVITGYVFYLIKLYKDNRQRLFWFLVGVTGTLLLLTLLIVFIGNNLQYFI